MASKKKESEGIALLSMYNDEDDEMEDLEKQEEEEEEEESNEQLQRREIHEEWREESYTEVSVVEEYSVVNRSEIMVTGGSTNNATPPLFGENSTPEKMKLGSLTSFPPLFTVSSSPMQQQTIQLDSDRVKTRGTLAIVEYGHDEAAMSPEAEEKEIEETGRLVLADELQPTPGDNIDEMSVDIVQNLSPSNQAISPQFSEPSRSGSLNCTAIDRESAQVDQNVTLEQKDVDPLDKFLPPPPKVKCSEDLQRKINKFLEYKKAGKSFNAEVRNRKDYRNPDFLLHAVSYQDIDQIGSCFDKDVFDPHGYDKSDYYLEIEADMKREMERKEQERKKSPKVEFVSGGTPLGPATKVNIPIPGIAPMPASDTIPRDGRQNKKSKWDKVDGDQRKPLGSSMQDMSGVGAHAALLSAANAGAGYTAFAQQKRWEAEERRSSERKLERRS